MDTQPFRAFPVTCGITFTYAGLHVDKNARVLNRDGENKTGLYACGEMIGGVFSAASLDDPRRATDVDLWECDK
ncbi:MAG: FAD-binding protein [Proteobacteria bacterium]|nr:FAD-binding protein [Pseudomonadota bacterium]